METLFYWLKKLFTKEIMLIILFLVQSNGIETVAQNDLSQFTFNAATVEYHRALNVTMTIEEKLNFTVRDYIRIIEGIKEDVDVIQFPESTLTSVSHPIKPEEVTEVPEAYSELLCNSSNSKYLHFLKQLSCAAVNKNATLVVNIIEKENCTSNNATGYCPSTGLLYHNTDVALNEKGFVSARYRKYNLYGEAGLSPTPQVEVVNFTTKNNVTFGIFTCFDILFEKPGLLLVRNGIRNILFPTMWFSQLPYLTALQTQQMWAQENNVTFISAGANMPLVGSGGTGIFLGYKGPLNYTIIGGDGGTQVLVHKIPRIDVVDNPYMNQSFCFEEDIDALSNELDFFHLKQDPSVVNGHTSVLLDTNKNNTIEEVCNGDAIKICCHFHIKIKTDKNKPVDKNVYTYHLAAFTGHSHYTNDIHGGTEACGVLACLNSSIESCGKKFPTFKDIYWPITFEYINVSAEFEIGDRIQFPNSVLASLRPICPQHTLWIREELEQKVRRSHILKTPQNKLLTFGIYGRDFNRDKMLSSASEKMQSINVCKILLAVFTALVFQITYDGMLF